MNEPLTLKDLTAYFTQGCKKTDEFYVGVEWEKIGVYKETGKAITYFGEHGVEAIFKELIHRYGWQPSGPGNPVIALKKGQGSITLEPGGQIELSGQKARRLDENAQELHQHLQEIKSISNPMGIAWLGIGAQPYSVAENIDWVPKDRYKIMRASLEGKGALTFSMMKETASVQVSLDYSSEQDALLKFKLAMGLSPFLIAMLANSPLRQGAPSGYLSRRAYIWEHTTPERAGILWDEIKLDGSWGFKGYVNYALEVPMLFMQREGSWILVKDINFKQFMEKGYQGYQATLNDWVLHLTGIFTEARLKQIVEIRSIDCQKSPMGIAAVALLKGIFYSQSSLEGAYKLISSFTGNELKTFHHEAAIHGLKTKLPHGGTIQSICQELFNLASDGLRDEKHYLDPLRDNLKKGITPAELLLNCFDHHQPIINCTAIEG